MAARPVRASVSNTHARASARSSARGNSHRQQVDEDGGRDRMPQLGHHLLPREQDAGYDSGHPIGRQQSPRQPLERAAGDQVPNHRQPRDLQQVDPGQIGIVGVEGVGQKLDRLPDRTHVPLVESPLQLAGQGRHLSPPSSQDPRRHGATVATAAAVSGDQAPAFGDRAGKGEVGGQAIEGAAQSVVVARTETDHGLAEQTPGRERRTPGHPLQKVRGPRPVAGIHRVETGHDRAGVPP